MKKIHRMAAGALMGGLLVSPFSTTHAANLQVKITPEMATASVKHDGKSVTIMRNQNQNNTINPEFAKTSRQCPPFCIRPFNTAEGVETIGELEVIAYAQKISKGAKGIMLVDNRTPDLHQLGTIPGAINVPYSKLNRSHGADGLSIAESLELFGAVEGEKGWDFSKAKTLVLFCNGMWCGQSPTAIDGLLAEGYPAERLKWYRGGMQSWEVLGLTTIKP